MFDFLKNDKESIYTITCKIVNYNWDILRALKTGVELKMDKYSLYYKKSLIGEISAPLVDYFNSVVVGPKYKVTLKTINPAEVFLDVSGEWLPTPDPVPSGPKGKDYTYKTISTIYPKMVPNMDYPCDLTRTDTGYDIYVDNSLIGKLNDIEGSNRIKTLERMLKSGPGISANVDPLAQHVEVHVRIRM